VIGASWFRGAQAAGLQFAAALKIAQVFAPGEIQILDLNGDV
jgi:hypothetical protein